MMPDETLNHWADRFVDAGMADVMSFLQFIELPPAMRERRLAQVGLIRMAQQCVGPEPPDATVHGDRLIDPMHHGARAFRRPSWFRRPRHV